MAFSGKGVAGKLNIKQGLILLAGLILLLLMVNSAVSPKNREFAFADTSTLSGYAWSDNIGWVSLSGSNYGLTFDSNGKLSGYAWSDNIGWITANESELSGCPSNPCRAKLNGNAFSGWLRALSNGGGWDGWISLSGSGYGVTRSGGTLSGYAWGSDVVGWLDFSLAGAPSCTPVYTCSGTQTILYTNDLCQTTTYATCTLPTFCSSGSSVCLYPQPTFIPTTGGYTGHLQPLPSLVSSGDTVNVRWNVDNVTSCTVTGTNGDGTGSNATGVWNTQSGNKTSSAILGQVTYTLTCTAYPGVTPATLSESAVVNIIPVFQEL